jgi:dTDP-4-dehydrorhamnose 3,5-epimerase
VEGLERRKLTQHPDGRGSLTEIFRESWKLGPCAVQWNLVRSKPKTVRGVHVHVTHLDYWMLVTGHATVGFRDLRIHSKTYGASGEIHLRGDVPELIVIPPGVAHGFQFRDTCIHLYAVTHYWDMKDELGCKWNDPELRIDWPGRDALLSPRDRDATSLKELLKELEPHQAKLCVPPQDSYRSDPPIG